ncbi:MAG: nuclear transport factor 2 family protein [Anaerolineae bacterium]|nr:nuclear transport factor 2 family protein [Anaerolineae bacterium]
MTAQTKQTDTKPSTADIEAIRQTVANYIEGWYTGDADRMAACLHPDLCKREISVHEKTGGSLLSPVSASWMVEFTRAGIGAGTPVEGRGYEVTIFDIYKDMASVKMAASPFVDYLHLAKFNGEWVIVNALWHRVTPVE